MTALSARIDDQIRQAAIERLGVADARLFRYAIRERPGVLDQGCWFCLFVQQTAGGEWTLLSRRRTKAELLQLLESDTLRG